MRKLLILVVLLSARAYCDLTPLPKTRHQQFLNLALFNEEKSGIVMTGGGRAWGEISASISVLEFSGLPFKPQLVLYGLVDVSFRATTWALDFLTETFDARIGMAFESVVDENLRFSLGLVHTSGHAADSILNPELIAPNMGDDVLIGRVVYDIDRTFRLGASLTPAIRSDPHKQFFGADQFIEWFPFKGAESGEAPSPFIALGLQEDGPKKLDMNYHIQAGLHFGNHFSADPRQSMRLVIGYYDGIDPRLKYGRILQGRQHFLFAGVWLNI